MEFRFHWSHENIQVKYTDTLHIAIENIDDTTRVCDYIFFCFLFLFFIFAFVTINALLGYVYVFSYACSVRARVQYNIHVSIYQRFHNKYKNHILYWWSSRHNLIFILYYSLISWKAEKICILHSKRGIKYGLYLIIWAMRWRIIQFE